MSSKARPWITVSAGRLRAEIDLVPYIQVEDEIRSRCRRRWSGFSDRQFLPALGGLGEFPGSEAPDHYFLLCEIVQLLCAAPKETNANRGSS